MTAIPPSVPWWRCWRRRRRSPRSFRAGTCRATPAGSAATKPTSHPTGTTGTTRPPAASRSAATGRHRSGPSCASGSAAKRAFYQEQRAVVPGEPFLSYRLREHHFRTRRRALTAALSVLRQPVVSPAPRRRARRSSGSRAGGVAAVAAADSGPGRPAARAAGGDDRHARHLAGAAVRDRRLQVVRQRTRVRPQRPARDVRPAFASATSPGPAGIGVDL